MQQWDHRCMLLWQNQTHIVVKTSPTRYYPQACRESKLMPGMKECSGVPETDRKWHSHHWKLSETWLLKKKLIRICKESKTCTVANSCGLNCRKWLHDLYSAFQNYISGLSSQLQALSPPSEGFGPKARLPKTNQTDSILFILHCTCNESPSKAQH